MRTDVEVALGFAIALAISLTGVGAGSMTTPLLILLLGVSPATAVGTALTFGAIVKVISLPVYVTRRQINFRALKFMLFGGAPGVLAGGLLLGSFKNGPYQQSLYPILGSLIACTALFHLYRTFRPNPATDKRDRSSLLPWFALPIGAEVGFSSAGAGALGSLLLFGFTKLSAAEVVGTDLCFGLIIASIGSAIQISSGNYDAGLLLNLVIGGVAGALTGSLLAGKLAPARLRIAVLAMLVVLGTQLALHGRSNNMHPTPIRAALSLYR